MVLVGVCVFVSGASACVGRGDGEWAWGCDGVGAVGAIDVGGGECVGGCGC